MGPNGEEIETAAIVTTPANRTLTPIHHRMPVIVPPDAFDFWLDCANVDAAHGRRACSCRRPRTRWKPARFRPRSTASANDGPEVLEPATAQTAPAPSPDKPAARAKKKDERQPSLFD